MYTLIYLVAVSRVESLRRFVESGRDATIKKRVLRYLLSKPDQAFSAVQLQRELSIRHRSSMCKPLKDLMDLGFIEVSSLVYDPETNRDVSAYHLANGYRNSINQNT